MSHRAASVVGGLGGLSGAACLLAGCALFSGNGQNEAVQGALRAVASPDGWSEPAPMEVACGTVDLDCQEVSARRVFHTDGDAAAACGGMVSYVASADAFVAPTGVRGTAEVAPGSADCQAELGDHQRYLVKADGASDVEGSSWRLRITPAAGGFDLSVVLGDPPRDPWS